MTKNSSFKGAITKCPFLIWDTNYINANDFISIFEIKKPKTQIRGNPINPIIPTIFTIITTKDLIVVTVCIMEVTNAHWRLST